MDLSRPTRIYVGAVTAAALALFAVLPRWFALPLTLGVEQMLLWLSGVVLILVAGYCPICIGPNVAVNMASTVMYAMLLLLPPLHAAAGAAVAIVLLCVFMRWPASDVLFNAGQTTLTVAGTGALVWSLGGGLAAQRLEVGQTIVIVAGAVAFYVLNSLLVTAWATLLRRTAFLPQWKRSFGRAAVPYLSTLLLGIVVAITYRFAPIILPILVLPIIAVHQSLQRANVIRNKTQETIELLADTVDQRDPYTFAHSLRVAALARRIAARMGLPREDQEAIAQAGRVHDLGKLGISDGLLLKAAKLTPQELESIRKHTVIGAEIVGKLPEYRQGKEYILFHHERYDGTGVFRLYGKNIPLGARIITVADAFDAMTSDRPYRKALTVDEATAEIAMQKGRQFDPVVAEALLEVLRNEAATVFADLPVRAPAQPVTRPSPAPT